MTPIYFPYTYISDQVTEAVAACFGRFMVYQPLADRLPATMQPWADEGVIDIRIPAKGDERELATAAKNYMKWADLNIGSTGISPSSLKTIKASARLLDSSLSSHIVAQVKGRAGSSTNDTSPDPVTRSRIFLYLAQKFDQQSSELDGVLEEFEKKEQALIKDLKTEEDSLADELKKDSGNIPDANTDYLIAERLEAWVRILLNDRPPPELFVTHRGAVLAHLLDAASRSEKILDVQTIPGVNRTNRTPTPWRDEIFSYLTEIIKIKWDAASIEKLPDLEFPPSENTVALKIYLVPNQNARQLFCHAAGIKDPGSDPTSPVPGAINTLLCLVEP